MANPRPQAAILDAKQAASLASAIQTLDQFIQNKEMLFSKEARDNGRGLTVRKGINPKAWFRVLGASKKSITHLEAINIRFIFLAYARYFKGHLQHIQKKSKQPREDIFKFWQNLFVILDIGRHALHVGSFHLLAAKILNEFAKVFDLHQENAVPKNEIEFRIAWPIYLASQDDATSLFKNMDCSVDKILEDAELKKIATTCSLDLAVYQHILHMSELAMLPQPEIIKRRIESAKLNAIKEQLDVVAKDLNLGKGVALTAMVRFSDGQMGMRYDKNRFKNFTLGLIAAEGVFNQKGEKLEDGWYQYVILAEGECKHEMRYFPCAEKAGSYIPYSKYVSHSEIAGALNVFAAGAFKIEDHLIVSIDDSSGHYHTFPIHLAYAKQYLKLLGHEKIEAIQFVRVKSLSLPQMVTKMQRKVSALAYSIWSPAHANKPQLAEGRVIPPRRLQGTHLQNERFDVYEKLLKRLTEVYHGQAHNFELPVVHKKRLTIGIRSLHLKAGMQMYRSLQANLAKLYPQEYDRPKFFLDLGGDDFYVSSIFANPHQKFDLIISVNDMLETETKISPLELLEYIRDNSESYVASFELDLIAMTGLKINVVKQAFQPIKDLSQFIVGMIGGMGPEADAYTLQCLYELLEKINKVREVRVCMLSDPKVPRTFFQSLNVIKLSNYILRLKYFLTLPELNLIIVPSNTFHTGNQYTWAQYESGQRILNMISAVAHKISSQMPNKKIGLLATQTTIQSGFYEMNLLQVGAHVIKPTHEFQQKVNDGIIAMKSGKRDLARELFLEVIGHLKHEGADVILLGCTEIPLALEHHLPEDILCLDSANILAEGVVNAKLQMEQNAFVLTVKAARLEYIRLGGGQSGPSKERIQRLDHLLAYACSQESNFNALQDFVYRVMTGSDYWRLLHISSESSLDKIFEKHFKANGLYEGFVASQQGRKSHLALVTS